ncbi:efflux RND transporter permease subunit [Methylocystis sp. MJC1]|jgi:multidrug efflux pump|uniref:efflux RND transporter permease subunit n=1 Tax=Methylocystis sp. MJC1 TaxID=2654282 RepID=UPI0013EDC1E6|nr:efflux RND transporter permease subunit [Methylocystis sp. MJC1]KAF2990679.1 Multidrug resistance protein MdtB [Methylocystis sp. MJC1]MBU6528720.1 efflux RND transporter permease subunit [Methylocystis sp. MJC1]UZX11608.1 efflux RND transporter permease subunit [Methylocystis sp. MJC1]
MNISAPFINRPVATSLMAFAVLLFGLLGYSRLSISPLPQVDFPTIQVTTQLPGANPDTIASLVTASLERQFGQIPSLASMSSQSSFGLSQVTLQFALDRDIDAAAQDVQAAINAAASTLPRDLPYPPVYAKVNPADTAVLTLTLRSKTATLRDLSDLADTLIAPQLSQVSGVGRVSVQGGVRPAVRIEADLARLAANRIGMEDLRQAVAAANNAGAKGSLDGKRQSYTLDANDQILQAKQYETIIVAWRNNSPVMLRDVAKVADGLENARVGGWYDGEQSIVLDVMRQPGANIIATVELVKETLPKLRGELPAGMSLDIVNDRTDTIRASIHEVEMTLLIAGGLVVAVVLLFLHSWRATLIAGVSLPLSIIATFFVMWGMGFSLDNLSLMALTIGTGFIVDDAIVMIENIVRNIERGKKPLQAALDGAREIGFTVVSLTVSLIAVFIPLLFMTGIVGRMFREFALTLSIAVVISAVISLTLTPMLCAVLLKSAPTRAHSTWEIVSLWLDRLYYRSLDWALKRETFMLALTAGTLALTVALYIVIPKGFLPRQDTGVLSVVMEAAPDASFERMKALQAQVTQVLRKDPEVTGVTSVLGVGPLNATTNVGRLTVTLRSREIRDTSADVIADRLKAAGEKVAGVSLFIEPVQDIQITTRPSRSQYQYTLTSADSGELMLWSNRLVDELRKTPGLKNVAAETQDGGLRALMKIDREKMGRLGISAQDVDNVLNDAFGQRQISTIYTQSNQYRVILEAAPQYLRDMSALEKLYVAPVGGGPQTPVATFVRVENKAAPLSVAHQDQFPASTISFDLADGVALGDAVKLMAQAQSAIGMPSSIIGVFSADAAEFNKSLASEPWLILAAIIAIYVVLGVLYESFAHPFTVLTTLPSAGVGALLALMILGIDMSIVALIGVVLLMGIVKKNAIMMIDFALEAERDEGMSPRESIVHAAHMRFRPIMMTTLAALFGALPLALATGPGSELRIPLGVSIIGGLLLSQALTLYTTPVIYLQVDRLRRRFLKPLRQDDEEEAFGAATEETPQRREAAE